MQVPCPDLTGTMLIRRCSQDGTDLEEIPSCGYIKKELGNKKIREESTKNELTERRKEISSEIEGALGSVVG